MSTHKSFASLTGSMLARKTVIRPAPQTPPAGSNDLDWTAPTDLPQFPFPAEVLLSDEMAAEALPEALPELFSEPLLASKPASAKIVPLVRAGTAAPVRPAGLKPLPVRRTRRAAFTLRLEPDRHLRLRVACSLQGRSAQALVTEAVDRLLASMPEVETLAEQIANPSIVLPLRETKP